MFSRSTCRSSRHRPRRSTCEKKRPPPAARPRAAARPAPRSDVARARFANAPAGAYESGPQARGIGASCGMAPTGNRGVWRTGHGWWCLFHRWRRRVSWRTGCLRDFFLRHACGRRSGDGYARDAMPEGGALSITVENAVLDEALVRVHQDARAGKYVVVKVSDRGLGEVVLVVGDEESVRKVAGLTGMFMSVIVTSARDPELSSSADAGNRVHSQALLPHDAARLVASCLGARPQQQQRASPPIAVPSSAPGFDACKSPSRRPVERTEPASTASPSS